MNKRQKIIYNLTTEVLKSISASKGLAISPGDASLFKLINNSSCDFFRQIVATKLVSNEKFPARGIIKLVRLCDEFVTTGVITAFRNKTHHLSAKLLSQLIVDRDFFFTHNAIELGVRVILVRNDVTSQDILRMLDNAEVCAIAGSSLITALQRCPDLPRDLAKVVAERNLVEKNFQTALFKARLSATSGKRKAESKRASKNFQ